MVMYCNNDIMYIGNIGTCNYVCYIQLGLPFARFCFVLILTALARLIAPQERAAPLQSTVCAILLALI